MEQNNKLLHTVYTINEARGLYSLESVPPKKEERLYNCPNCGAPITGDKCEYCGTVFRDRFEDAVTYYADNAQVLTIEMDTKQLCDRITTERINGNLVKAIRW